MINPLVTPELYAAEQHLKRTEEAEQQTSLEEQQRLANRRALERQIELQREAEKESTPVQGFQRVTRDGESALVPLYGVECDEPDPHYQAQAEALARLAREQAEQAEREEFTQFEHLSPTRYLIAVEETAIPKLKQLSTRVQEACDLCEQYSHTAAEQLRQQALYVNELKHSKYVLFWLNSPEHRNQLLKSGTFPPEGFHVYREEQAHGSRQTRVYLLADGYKEPSELYTDAESEAYAKRIVEHGKEKADRQRKEALREMTAYKAKVEAALDAVPTMKKLLKNF